MCVLHSLSLVRVFPDVGVTQLETERWVLSQTFIPSLVELGVQTSQKNGTRNRDMVLFAATVASIVSPFSFN